jgi:hypothetical protein
MNLAITDQRWGTQATFPMFMDLSLGNPNRGPVRVFLRSEEMPPSWRVNIVE